MVGKEPPSLRNLFRIEAPGNQFQDTMYIRMRNCKVRRGKLKYAVVLYGIERKDVKK